MWLDVFVALSDVAIAGVAITSVGWRVAAGSVRGEKSRICGIVSTVRGGGRRGGESPWRRGDDVIVTSGCGSCGGCCVKRRGREGSDG